MLSVIGIFKLFLTNKYFFKYIKRFVFKKTKGPKKEENLSFNYIIKKQKIPQNQNYSKTIATLSGNSKSIINISNKPCQCRSYIMATSFSGGRSRSPRKEPPTMGKQLVNFISCDCVSSASFIVFYKPGPSTVYLIT
jgi:hypothetical protein